MLSTKDVIKQVRRLEIITKKRVEGFISGNYQSVFKGSGVEFSDLRDYRAGDDIRAIDWKVTARFNHPYIKEFIEERDLNVYIAFDMSASSNFGSAIEKKKKALEITATLIFSAIHNNDSVGLFLCTEGVEKYIPPRKGKRHAFTLISEIIRNEPVSKKTNLSDSIRTISNIIKKRSVVFIVSDFFSDDFSKSLSILKRRHDVIAIKVADVREKNIPDVGLIQLEDEETGEQILLDTSDEEFRKEYASLIKKHDAKMNEIFKRNNVDTIEFSTDEETEKSLHSFFKLRAKRVVP